MCLVALLSAVLSSGVEAGVVAQEAGTSLAPSWLTSLAPVERFDAFFETVDRWLWDSEDMEGRMYRRGQYILLWSEVSAIGLQTDPSIGSLKVM